MICPCGCGREAKQKYATSGCAGRHLFRQDTPQTKAWRSQAGKATARAAYHQRLEMAEGKTPKEALDYGYSLGYRRAYTKWHRWAEKYIREHRQMPAKAS